jgi:hypothetical protein
MDAHAGDLDRDELVEHRLYAPRVFLKHKWYWRCYHMLAASVIFLLYTGTVYPLHMYMFVPMRIPGLTVLYYVLLALTLATWFKTQWTDPGRAGAEWYQRLAAGSVSVRECTWCHKCAAPRPLRAHHCR